MARWQALPESLPPEARHLVEELRRLKDRTGLSLAELAARTAYSKSSWQRYLNGAKPPPRMAVQALGRVAGADQARLLALWELTDRTWPKGVPGDAAAPPGEVVLLPPAVPVPVRSASWAEPHRWWRAVALGALAVAVVLLAGLVWAVTAGVG